MLILKFLWLLGVQVASSPTSLILHREQSTATYFITPIDTTDFDQLTITQTALHILSPGVKTDLVSDDQSFHGWTLTTQRHDLEPEIRSTEGVLDVTEDISQESLSRRYYNPKPNPPPPSYTPPTPPETVTIIVQHNDAGTTTIIYKAFSPWNICDDSVKAVAVHTLTKEENDAVSNWNNPDKFEILTQAAKYIAADPSHSLKMYNQNCQYYAPNVTETLDPKDQWRYKLDNLGGSLQCDGIMNAAYCDLSTFDYKLCGSLGHRSYLVKCPMPSSTSKTRRHDLEPDILATEGVLDVTEDTSQESLSRKSVAPPQKIMTMVVAHNTADEITQILYKQMAPDIAGSQACSEAIPWTAQKTFDREQTHAISNWDNPNIFEILTQADGPIGGKIYGQDCTYYAPNITNYMDKDDQKLRVYETGGSIMCGDIPNASFCDLVKKDDNHMDYQFCKEFGDGWHQSYLVSCPMPTR